MSKKSEERNPISKFEIEHEYILKEEDDELPWKVRPVSLIKFNPFMFNLHPRSQIDQTFRMLGSYPTICTTILGSSTCLYFQMTSNPLFKGQNFYVQKLKLLWTGLFGAALGFGIGVLRFGDKQRWLNHRMGYCVLKKYSQAEDINRDQLWKCKALDPDIEYDFYRWK